MRQGDLKKHENGTWYIHWTEGRRSRRVSARTTNYAQARAVLRSWERLQDLAPKEQLTVAELWLRYDEGHLQKKGLRSKSSEGAWLRLAPFFGGLRPEEITPAKIDLYCAGRARAPIPVIASTVRRELTSLIACLNWAAHRAQKLLTPDEVPYIKLPPMGVPRDRWLRPAEVAKLFAQAKADRIGGRIGRTELFLWLALETSARKGAILGLTWDRVDLERGVIDYRDPNRPVTKKRRVAVPISKALRPIILQAYAERNPTNPLVLGGGAIKMEYHVGVVAERAGIRGVTPHVLRHTAATLMARNGVPLWHIASILGNSVAMIENVYAKHAPDMQRAAVESISGAAWAPPQLSAEDISDETVLKISPHREDENAS